MKPSKYNIISKIDNNTYLAFNSLTCALAEVNEDFFEILQNAKDINYEQLNREKKELFDNMLLGNYIIDDKFDELKAIKYRLYSSKFNEDDLVLTLAPTLACNFACSYCYESFKKGAMSKNIQNAIIDMVSNAAKKKKNVNITWYGGEPLLEKDIIANMSRNMIESCNENHVKYSSFIVTNGYLIDCKTASFFKESKISGAQITLDGPAQIHNSRRMLRNGNSGTFDTILNNIINLFKSGFNNINIRINVDNGNITYIEDILNILIDVGLKDVDVSLGHVNAYTEACTSIAESCLITEEYAKINLDFHRMLQEKGFNISKLSFYPRIRGTHCCADSNSSYVIDPLGYKYKCWNDVGIINKAVGKVVRNDNMIANMNMMNLNYVLWSPFDSSECVECNLLPICMGGCPYNCVNNNSKPECEEWKYNLEDIIKLVYLQKKTEDFRV